MLLVDVIQNPVPIGPFQ